MSEGKLEKVKLSDICLDEETQMRVNGLNLEKVEEYAEDMEKGDKFPPCTLIREGKFYWIIGGYHRIAAYKKRGKRSIEAFVTEGTKRDAILLSLSENATHGLRRTNADKRKAVLTLLQDPEWSLWSNSEIARKGHVSRSMVIEIRTKLSCKNLQDRNEPEIGIPEEKQPTSNLDTQSEMPKKAISEQPKKVKVRRGKKTYEMKVNRKPSEQILSCKNLQDRNEPEIGIPEEKQPTSNLDTQSEMPKKAISEQEKLTRTLQIWGVKKDSFQELIYTLCKAVGTPLPKSLRTSFEHYFNPEETEPTLQEDRTEETFGDLGSWSLDKIKSSQVKVSDLPDKSPEPAPQKVTGAANWLTEGYEPLADDTHIGEVEDSRSCPLDEEITSGKSLPEDWEEELDLSNLDLSS